VGREEKVTENAGERLTAHGAITRQACEVEREGEAVENGGVARPLRCFPVQSSCCRRICVSTCAMPTARGAYVPANRVGRNGTTAVCRCGNNGR